MDVVVDGNGRKPSMGSDQLAFFLTFLHSRGHLSELFGQIQKEFESLYAENLDLKEKVETLSEQLGDCSLLPASGAHELTVNAHTGHCIVQYAGHDGLVNSVRFHPTQDLLVTASGDQSAYIWRAATSAAAVLDLVKGHSSEDEVDLSEKEDDSDSASNVFVIKSPLTELTGHSSFAIASDWLSRGSLHPGIAQPTSTTLNSGC
ncbi:hypothetical protein HPB49_012527 [Dermacentor silvarum]|uniref:Uncharacterized protein n=1 Tax=Dermacentor silvarum TaxID=543639 RepID=A0ACB8C3X9_DERSI|nr:hypothetical protein HPB49_012527 [Dermacentor silvarum]